MYNRQVAEDIFNIVFEQALIDDSIKEMDSLNIGNEKITFSVKLERAINNIERSYQRRMARGKFKKAMPKIGATAAALIMIISLATNPYVSAAMKSIFEQIFPNYTSHEFYGDGTVNIDNFNYDIRPEYLPEGYRISQINYRTAHIRVSYTNEDSQISLIYSIAGATDFGIDTKNAIRYEFVINDNSAIYYESFADDKPSYLIWEYKGYAFMLTAQIDEDEFVKIAESIKIG